MARRQIRLFDTRGLVVTRRPGLAAHKVPFAYKWSKGKAIYAGGVQFPLVHLNGQTLLPSQGNNLYNFPAVSLAIYLTRPKRVIDEMFIEAAEAVADQVSPEQLKLGMLFPPQSDIS